MSTGLMAGKRGLIMGLANDKSIAWGIAKTLADHGAEMAFSYQGEALGKRADFTYGRADPAKDRLYIERGDYAKEGAGLPSPAATAWNTPWTSPTQPATR